MAKITLSQPIYDLDHNVTTGAALLDAGRAIVERCDNFSARTPTGVRTAYFLALLLPDGTNSHSVYEIGALAYKSRMGEAIQL